MTRFAVASKDYKTVTGHSGRARRWIVIEADGVQAPQEVARIELTKDQVFHYHLEPGPHPLNDCEIIVGANCGDGFYAHMEKLGRRAVMTSETDPFQAVQDVLSGRVKPPHPRPIMGLVCKAMDAFSGDKDK